MTKTQYYTATSIDGYIADQDNSLEWLFEADSGGEGYASFAPFFADVGAFCMGATTFEWVMAHEGPEKWREMWGDMPCWVFTHRDLASPGGHVTFVSGDVAPVHRELVEAAAGKNIWLVGGGELVGQFADRGLLDEIILGVAPPLTYAVGPPAD